MRAKVVPARVVLYRNIPAELTRLSRRVTWRHEERNKKMTKPPLRPGPVKKAPARVTILSTRGTFEETRNAFLDRWL